MDIQANSVWLFDKFTWFPAGKYRILQFSPDLNLLALFKLSSTSSTQKPILISVDKFSKLITEMSGKPDDFPLPGYMSLPESQLPEVWKRKRDYRLSIIKKLIDDPLFVFRFAARRKKFSEVVDHAASINQPTLKIYRLLSMYWRYAQTPNSLLPAYSLSGARGKDK